MKLLNGMQSDKAKFVIDNEIKLLDRGDHPVLRSANLIVTRELILNMLHFELKDFNHDKLYRISNLINDLKNASINVIISIVEWRD